MTLSREGRDAFRVLLVCGVIASVLPFVYPYFSYLIYGIPVGLALAGLAYFVLIDAKSSLTGEAFARRLGKVNAALLIFTFAFPFMLFAFFKLVNPSRDAPIGLVITLMIKPIVYVAYVLAVLAITRQRMASLNLDRTWLIALAITLYSLTVFWLTASAPWSVGFSLGASGGVPNPAIAIYAALLPLCLVVAAGSSAEARQRKVLDSRLRTICAVILSAIVILGVGHEWLTKFTSNYELMRISAQLSFWLAPLVAAFPLAILVLCFRLWDAAGRPGDGSQAKTLAAIIASAIGAIAVLNTAVFFLSLVWSFSFPAWRTVYSFTAVLRVFELWGLMLLPLVIAWMLRSANGAIAGDP